MAGGYIGPLRHPPGALLEPAELARYLEKRQLYSARVEVGAELVMIKDGLGLCEHWRPVKLCVGLRWRRMD